MSYCLTVFNYFKDYLNLHLMPLSCFHIISGQTNLSVTINGLKAPVDSKSLAQFIMRGPVRYTIQLYVYCCTKELSLSDTIR